MPPFHILLIDDHAMFRSGLRMVLGSSLDEVEISEASGLSETFGERPAPHLILLDIQLPGLNGLDAITSLRQRWPEAAIVVLSALHTSSNVELAHHKGADAFVSKTETADNIIAVIERIRGEPGRPTTEQPTTPLLDNRPRLTPRQCDILELLSQGLTNKVIARKLELSENTVRWHVQALLELFQVSSRSEAVFMARNKGLIE